MLKAVEAKAKKKINKNNNNNIFKNTTALFSFQNMFRCFKHHHQP